MKKLLLLFLFSGSLDGFSQVNADSLLKKVDDLIARCKKMGAEMDEYEKNNLGDIGGVVKPDTLRAIVLVTLFQNGPAHARMGYVVIQDGRKPVYLDCNKKALKLPQVGWGWEVVDSNYKK